MNTILEIFVLAAIGTILATMISVFASGPVDSAGNRVNAGTAWIKRFTNVWEWAIANMYGNL